MHKKILERYLIRESIGKGAMGNVYLALDTKLNQMVAIKELKLSNLESQTEAILRFKREAEILEQLSHPNIIKIYNLIEEKNEFFLVMEYFQGKNLKDALPSLNLMEKAGIMLQIAQALSYIHQHEIIHRDLKPKNLLVNDKLQVKIIDFGLAYLTNLSDLLGRSAIVGSFAYISPEQTGLLRRPVDSRSDLYSLGAAFYELLTDMPPFTDKNAEVLIHKHLAKVPDPPSSLNREIPKILDAILLKLLAKEPSERYQTAMGLASDLEMFIAHPDKSFPIAIKDKSHTLNFQFKLLGREKELGLIREVFQSVAQGTPQFITIRGAVGVGKSKLIESFRESIASENVLFLTFKCNRSTQNIPLAPFSELLQKYFKKNYQTNFEREIINQWQQQFNLFSSLFPQIKRFFPPDNLQNSKSKEEKKSELLNEILAFFEQITRKKHPVIFSIDDLHWADQDTLELIYHLGENLAEQKILFLLTLQEEASQNVLTRLKKLNGSFHFLDLKPLDKEQLHQLVNLILGDNTTFRESIYDKIYDCTLGNPFFVQEMVRDLVDQNIFFHTEYEWDVSLPNLEKFRFSKDITELLLRRLQVFSPKEQQILAIGAIIGKDFDMGLLGEILSIQNNAAVKIPAITLGQVIEVLDKAIRENLIEEDLSAQGTYRFINSRIADTFKNQLSNQEQAQLHLLCAQTLERIFAKAKQTEVYQLAYHYNFTNDAQKMLYYNEQAYKKALSQNSINEAVYYMEKIIRHHIHHNTLDQEIIQLILEMTKYQLALGKMAEAIDYLEKAMAFARETGLKAEEIQIDLRTGTSYYLSNDTGRALKFYKMALHLGDELGEEINDPYPYRLMASSYWFSADIAKALEYFTKAISYTETDDWGNLIHSHGMRAWAYTFSGDMDLALKDISFIEKIIPRQENPLLLSQAYHLCAVCYAWGGLDYQKALSYSEESFAHAKEIDYILFQYSSLASKTLAYFYQNEFQKAKETLNTALELSRDHSLFIGVYFFYSFQGIIHLWEKNFERANEIALQYLQEEEKIPEKTAILIFLKIRAIYEFYHGDFPKALSVIEKAQGLYEKTGILLEGIFFFLLQKHILELEKKDTDALQQKINQLIKDKTSFMLVYEREKGFVAYFDDARKEKEIRDSYISSTSAIKEKLQLDNIIKTSQKLSSILEIDKLLSVIVEKTLEVTGAERGTLLLYDEKTKKLDYQVLQNIEPDKEKFEISKTIIDKVIQTRRGMVLTDINKYQFNTSGSIVAQNIKSIICAPLTVQSHVIGLLYLDSKLLNNLFTEKDLELLNVFTSQAAISIENAKLHSKMLEQAKLQKEIEVAKDIQLSLLPTVKELDDYEISTYMKAAEEVGGDYYDFHLCQSPYLGVFGDVSGHGLKSGLIMMMAEVAFNTVARHPTLRLAPLPELYQQINLTLYENIQERLAVKSLTRNDFAAMYMTFKLYRLDSSGKLEIFGADHVEPFICRAQSGEIISIPSQGFLLGVLDDAIRGKDSLTYQLFPGDLLVFFSDGISEAKNEPKLRIEGKNKKNFMFGEAKIHELISSHRHLSPETLINTILDAVHDFMHIQEDDMALVIIKKK